MRVMSDSQVFDGRRMIGNLQRKSMSLRWDFSDWSLTGKVCLCNSLCILASLCTATWWRKGSKENWSCFRHFSYYYFQRVFTSLMWITSMSFIDYSFNTDSDGNEWCYISRVPLFRLIPGPCTTSSGPASSFVTSYLHCTRLGLQAF